MGFKEGVIARVQQGVDSRMCNGGVMVGAPAGDDSMGCSRGYSRGTSQRHVRGARDFSRGVQQRNIAGIGEATGQLGDTTEIAAMVSAVGTIGDRSWMAARGTAGFAAEGVQHHLLDVAKQACLGETNHSGLSVLLAREKPLSVVTMDGPPACLLASPHCKACDAWSDFTV